MTSSEHSKQSGEGQQRRLEGEERRALTFEVEPDFLDGGWVATCDQMPGAMGQGETAAEAIKDCRRAAEAIRELEADR